MSVPSRRPTWKVSSRSDAQVVEERRDQRQVRVAVEIARADQQRPHADRVQGARRIGAHPALRDECAQQGVGAAAWHVERVADLAQPRGIVVAGGQVLQQFHGPHGGLHLAYGEVGCRSRRAVDMDLSDTSASYRQEFAADQHDGAHALRRRSPTSAVVSDPAHGSGRGTARSRRPRRGSRIANITIVCPLTAPVAARATIDITEPTRKKPLIVLRNRAPSLRCHTRAIGGPPMAVAVPRTPEAAPASTTLRRRATGIQPKLVSATPTEDDEGEHDREPTLGQHRQQ